MTLALSTEGMIVKVVEGSAIAAPTISNVSPDPNEEPGEPGAFSAIFSVARVTPITFQLSGIAPGALISITVKFATRNEKLTALDFDGVWCWPFDVTGPNDNQIGVLSVEPVNVQLLPRGGWPPGAFLIQVAAIAKAS